MNPAVQDSRADRPVEGSAGIHAARERRWGWIGGTAGALAGVGSAFVAVLLDGASWFEAGPYPSVFRQPRLLALDVYLASMLAAGLAFSVIGLFHVRRSPYPRSDAYGAGLLGTILGVLAGAILLLRVVALTRGG